ncbi:MAG: type II toxin-antitoxin system RelE/ParE family toxin [Candidatus Saccharimonadales bacterium]
MRIALAKTASKDIKKCPPQLQKRIYDKLNFFLAQRDPLVFAEPLTQPFDAQYRFRIGNYRVLFDVEGDMIVILHVQHRREVYR